MKLPVYDHKETKMPFYETEQESKNHPASGLVPVKAGRM
jgi:hypothetical protein